MLCLWIDGCLLQSKEGCLSEGRRILWIAEFKAHPNLAIKNAIPNTDLECTLILLDTYIFCSVKDREGYLL